MMQLRRAGVATAVVFATILAAAHSALSHGDVAPQPMNTAGLPPLGDKWLAENPYRGNPLAIKIGETGYNQNCAR